MSPRRTTPGMGATTAPGAGASVATDLRAAQAVRPNVRGPVVGSAAHAVGSCSVATKGTSATAPLRPAGGH